MLSLGTLCKTNVYLFLKFGRPGLNNTFNPSKAWAIEGVSRSTWPRGLVGGNSVAAREGLGVLVRTQGLWSSGGWEQSHRGWGRQNRNQCWNRAWKTFVDSV